MWGYSVIEDIFCPLGCSDGACIQNATNQTCTDSDGGLNYYTKGNVTACISSSSSGDGGISSSGGGGCGFSSDSCNGNILVEKYCDGNSLGTQSYPCPNGCSNGACVNATNVTATCTDSDGGLNYYNKGYGTGIYVGSADPNYHAIYGQEPDPLTVKPSPYSYSIFYDHCLNTKQINEAYCLENGKLGAHGTACPNGCSNGACIRSAPTASLLGPKSATAGDTLSFRGTIEADNPRGEIWVTKSDKTAVPDCPVQIFTASDGTKWCNLAKSEGRFISGNYTPTKAGEYVVAVNGFVPDTRDTYLADYFTAYNDTQCTGNPWTVFPDAQWSDCGANDTIMLKVYDKVASADQKTLSLTLTKGWNMISRSVDGPGTFSTDCQFGYTLYTWKDGNWEAFPFWDASRQERFTTETELGRAYWLYVYSDKCSWSMKGVTARTIAGVREYPKLTLTSGWNMVGGIEGGWRPYPSRYSCQFYKFAYQWNPNDAYAVKWNQGWSTPTIGSNPEKISIPQGTGYWVNLFSDKCTLLWGEWL